MKLTGTIKRNELEGGSWTLVTAKGETYTLIGTTTGAKDGMHAEVEGKVEKAAMGIGVMGPQLSVSKITPAK